MPPRPARWPIRSGDVPFLADGFTWRPETGRGPSDRLHPGSTIILGPADPRSPAWHRYGTGKTQLAAAFAAQLWAAGGLDLLVWLDAGSRDSIIGGYAGALAAIRVAAPPGKPEAAAARFLTWLAGTRRRWLVVLDGLAESADADGLWPHGPSGQVVVTTALAGLTPKPPPSGTTPDQPPALAHEAVAVPAFSQREALSYLSGRLNDDPYQVAGALDLAIDLDCLPVALSLAVSYLLDSGLDCRQYRLAREQYRQIHADLAADDLLAPSWMLAVDRASQLAPAGLAWPALRLAAVFGPAKIPGTVLTSAAACGYVTGRPAVTTDDQASLQAAFGSLHRLGLVTIDPDDETRTVSMPASLQFSVRQVMGQAEVHRAVLAAADGICESWPARRHQAGLEQALRDAATGLERCDDLALWASGCHLLLARIGRSLDDAQMAETAAIRWRDLAMRSAEYLGALSPATLQFRDRLATASAAAVHADEAIPLREDLVADVDSVLGPIDPQAVASRASLAVALRAAGRLPDALSLCQRVAADSDLVFGPAHPQTTEIMRELASGYADAGKLQDAIGIMRRCLTQCERATGLMNSETIAVRHHLAGIYRRADRQEEAIRLYQEALAAVERSADRARPDAAAAREHLAIAWYQAGRTDDAVAMLGQAIAAWRLVAGASPADTIAARANLAAMYCLSGRMKDAIPLYESEIADLRGIRGPDHADTLRARWNLAAACHMARRLSESVQLGEAALADCEQVLGRGHRETLSSRANLAHAYHAAGRLKGASAHFDRALRDCEQALGPDDPLTVAVRALRKRYLAGRQGAAPIITLPSALPARVAPAAPARRAAPVDRQPGSRRAMTARWSECGPPGAST